MLPYVEIDGRYRNKCILYGDLGINGVRPLICVRGSITKDYKNISYNLPNGSTALIENRCPIQEFDTTFTAL